MTGLAKCYRTFVTKASFTRGWGFVRDDNAESIRYSNRIGDIQERRGPVKPAQIAPTRQQTSRKRLEPRVHRGSENV
ncbi:hypothetical protein C4K17_2803 [Pseudomonas chlororaphis subsp. aurantiaca]|nr:hypothetical protein C4K17_2803 [Pseudomonas chlororaphis subsp. aurantiaca]